jgi:hypothetical protein
MIWRGAARIWGGPVRDDGGLQRKRLRLGMEEVFLRCDEEGERTRLVVDFFPHVSSQVYLDRLGPLRCSRFQPPRTTRSGC